MTNKQYTVGWILLGLVVLLIWGKYILSILGLVGFFLVPVAFMVLIGTKMMKTKKSLLPTYSLDGVAFLNYREALRK